MSCHHYNNSFSGCSNFVSDIFFSCDILVHFTTVVHFWCVVSIYTSRLLMCCWPIGPLLGGLVPVPIFANVVLFIIWIHVRSILLCSYYFDIYVFQCLLHIFSGGIVEYDDKSWVNHYGRCLMSVLSVLIYLL